MKFTAVSLSGLNFGFETLWLNVLGAMAQYMLLAIHVNKYLYIKEKYFQPPIQLLIRSRKLKYARLASYLERIYSYYSRRPWKRDGRNRKLSYFPNPNKSPLTPTDGKLRPGMQVRESPSRVSKNVKIGNKTSSGCVHSLGRPRAFVKSCLRPKALLVKKWKVAG